MNRPHLSSQRAVSTTPLNFIPAPGNGRTQLILPTLQVKKEYRPTDLSSHSESALAKPQKRWKEGRWKGGKKGGEEGGREGRREGGKEGRKGGKEGKKRKGWKGRKKHEKFLVLSLGLALGARLNLY